MMKTIYEGTFLRRSVPFLLIVCAACGLRNKNTTAASGKSSLQKSTTMETINMTVGDSTRLRFKSLSTSGYLWRYEQNPTGIITITTEGSTEPAQTPPGQSPDEIFKITAIAPGTVHLTFKQQRSWQKDAAPHDVKEYIIEVK